MPRLPLTLAALLLAPLAAQAQQPPQPDVVLLPRDVVESVREWMFAPNPQTAIRLFAALNACIADNPVNGHIMRQGQDQCPAVTAALAERDKELADARKAAEKPAAPAEPKKN